MNRTASDTIAAAIQVPTFFLEDSFIFFCVRILINIIGNESGDKSNVTYNWDPQKADSQKGARKGADSQKKGSVKQKVWEPLILAYKKRHCCFHSFNSIRLNSKLNSLDLIGFKSRFVFPTLCLRFKIYSFCGVRCAVGTTETRPP